jgi:hypothetical protein
MVSSMRCRPDEGGQGEDLGFARGDGLAERITVKSLA